MKHNCHYNNNNNTHAPGSVTSPDTLGLCPSGCSLAEYFKADVIVPKFTVIFFILPSKMCQKVPKIRQC